MHRVDDGRVDSPAERRGREAGVVVDDVELVRALVAGERVVELGEREPDATREGATSKTERSSAFVFESPDAKSVTSWPASTRPSASSATTHSMPP